MARLKDLYIVCLIVSEMQERTVHARMMDMGSDAAPSVVPRTLTCLESSIKMGVKNNEDAL